MMLNSISFVAAAPLSSITVLSPNTLVSPGDLVKISFKGDAQAAIRTTWFKDSTLLDLVSTNWELEASNGHFSISKTVASTDAGTYMIQQTDSSFTKQQKVSGNATLSMYGRLFYILYTCHGMEWSVLFSHV